MSEELRDWARRAANRSADAIASTGATIDRDTVNRALDALTSPWRPSYEDLRVRRHWVMADDGNPLGLSAVAGDAARGAFRFTIEALGNDSSQAEQWHCIGPVHKQLVRQFGVDLDPWNRVAESIVSNRGGWVGWACEVGEKDPTFKIYATLRGGAWRGVLDAAGLSRWASELERMLSDDDVPGMIAVDLHGQNPDALRKGRFKLYVAHLGRRASPEMLFAQAGRLASLAKGAASADELEQVTSGVLPEAFGSGEWSSRRDGLPLAINSTLHFAAGELTGATLNVPIARLVARRARTTFGFLGPSDQAILGRLSELAREAALPIATLEPLVRGATAPGTTSPTVNVVGYQRSGPKSRLTLYVKPTFDLKQSHTP